MKEQLIEIINRLPGIEVVCISDPDDNKQPIKCTSSNIHRGGFTIFFHVDEGEQEGLFFLTRCVDGRYFQYGLNWRIQLSVGDVLHRNGDRPITYELKRIPLQDDTEEDLQDECKALVDNMSYHFNHVGFVELYNMNKDKYKISRLHYTATSWNRKSVIENLGI